jgi:hypothetical protein
MEHHPLFLYDDGCSVVVDSTMCPNAATVFAKLTWNGLSKALPPVVEYLGYCDAHASTHAFSRPASTVIPYGIEVEILSRDAYDMLIVMAS